MFKDVQLSKDLMSNFNKMFQDNLDITLDVNVCTTGFWPRFVEENKKRKERRKGEKENRRRDVWKGGAELLISN